ncbi:MAG: NADH-quinone oxidoreductase subunit C [Rhodospirillaceae bacterium]
MATKLERLNEALTAALGDKIVSATAGNEITIVVRPDDLLSVATKLRDAPELRFEQLMDLCGIDYLAYGIGGTSEERMARMRELDVRVAGPESVEHPSRFAVVYHLLSVTHNWRVRMRVYTADDSMPMVDSVVGVWPSANWFEREAFDLYGIVFTGHPDLRRILTDYGFIGNPFRKDFPISGNVEMRYDPDQRRVIYQPVTIEPREVTPRIVREENYADSEGIKKG